MNDYVEFMAQDRRLAILRILAKLPGYACNESVLHSAVVRFGHQASRDQVRADVSWLAEAGLLSAEIVESVTIATLAMRGLDVAEGRATVPGVKRPSPRG